MNMRLLPCIGFSLSHHDWFTTQILQCLPHVCLTIVTAVLLWFPHALWTWTIYLAAHSFWHERPERQVELSGDLD